MNFNVLTAVAAISACACIWAKYNGPQWLFYLAKPLTTTLVIVIATTFGFGPPVVYRVAIMVGLVCSLAGDVFLMLPGDRFIFGLLSFLLAHILFTVAFVSGAGFGFTSWVLLAIVVPTGCVVAYLWPGLGRLRLPVLVYVGAIAVMAWQAWERALTVATIPSVIAGIGTLLFLVSDSTLAINKFRRKFVAAEAIILSTYFISIWCIAASLAPTTSRV